MVIVEPAAVAIRGSWWRHTPPGGDPWHLPTAPASNRWQRGPVIAALYLADSRETAWAEWYRHLAEIAMPPLQALPRELWRWQVDLGRVADLRSPEALGTLGLPAPRPTRRDWPSFQRVGEALHADGWPALVAPSAARPPGRVLCVFRPVAPRRHRAVPAAGARRRAAGAGTRDDDLTPAARACVLSHERAAR